MTSYVTHMSLTLQSSSRRTASLPGHHLDMGVPTPSPNSCIRIYT